MILTKNKVTKQVGIKQIISFENDAIKLLWNQQ